MYMICTRIKYIESKDLIFPVINENGYRDVAVNLNTKELRSMQSMGEAFYI